MARAHHTGLPSEQAEESWPRVNLVKDLFLWKKGALRKKKIGRLVWQICYESNRTVVPAVSAKASSYLSLLCILVLFCINILYVSAFYNFSIVFNLFISNILFFRSHTVCWYIILLRISCLCLVRSSLPSLCVSLILSFRQFHIILYRPRVAPFTCPLWAVTVRGYSESISENII